MQVFIYNAIYTRLVPARYYLVAHNFGGNFTKESRSTYC